MELPRHGVVEIETLRRYGRVPVGTRAAGTFAVWVYPVPPPGRPFHVLRARVPVADDPRVVGVHVLGNFFDLGDGPRVWHAKHRRQMTQFRAVDTAEYVLVSLKHYLEDQSTGTGAQRFAVTRLEWRDGEPLPGWAAEEIEQASRRS